MSEFTTPFSTIVRKDIRHMISIFPGPGNVPSPFRRISPYPSSDNLRQRSDQDLKKSVLRMQEDSTLSGASGTYIPRAPAFRALSHEELKVSFDRISKPTLASDYKRHHSELAESECSNSKSMDFARETSSKFMGLHKVKKGEMTNLVTQLTRPTLISEIRHRYASERKNPVKAVEKCKEKVYGRNPRSLRRLPRTEAIIESMARFQNAHPLSPNP